MADYLSVQLVAFNFTSRTFAYNFLAQGLITSVTGFSSFVKRYLDPCPAAKVGTQFMDDIAAGVNNFDEMIPALPKNSIVWENRVWYFQHINVNLERQKLTTKVAQLLP